MYTYDSHCTPCEIKVTKLSRSILIRELSYMTCLNLLSNLVNTFSIVTERKGRIGRAQASRTKGGRIKIPGESNQ